MIPQCVRLKGFLCYKDEQEISFDGSSLWMLAGLNGSGKSSVFDAVTYALFGHHRGGSQDAHELINKESDKAAVAFEFALDGETYQIHRTLQRTKQGRGRSTQQIYRRSTEGKWEAVEDTNLKAGFDEWVAANIGLSYETFTSSVLLLQGKAEKLLDSTAKGRFEVLAGIVDLERYDRLHQKADEQRKALRGRAEELHNRLAAIPEVSPLELIEAESRIAEAEDNRDKAQQETDRLQGLEFQSRQWAELQKRLGEVRGRLREGQQLLADSAAIEKAVERLRELREVLPRLQTALRHRRQIEESERKTAEFLQHRTQAEETLTQHNNALKQENEKRNNLQAQLAVEEKRQREVAEQFRKVTGQLERLKEYERQENDLVRLQEDLARLPADPTAVVRKARAAHEDLSALNQVLPLLVRLQTLRDDLRHATAREKAAREARQSIQQQGEQLKAEVERLRPLLQEATQARQEADEEATRARTLQEQARQSLHELMLLRGAKLCRHCGQKLTPGHVAEEKDRRQHEATSADERAKKTATAQEAAQKNERALTEALTDLEKRLAEAREAFREEKSRAGHAREDVERLQRECAQTYADLPEPFRVRVSPTLTASWLETLYPTPEDLSEERQRVSGLSAARQCLSEAENALKKWGELKAQEATIRQTLTRMQEELPPNRKELRQEHINLDNEEKALQSCIEARRLETIKVQNRIDEQAREREGAEKAIAQIQGKLNTEEAVRQQSRLEFDSARKELPPSWQQLADSAGLAEVTRLGIERDELAQDHTEEKGQQLRQARAEQEVLGDEQTALEGQEAQYPPEARQEPAAVQALLQAARQTFRTRDDELSRERKEKALLEERHEQREQLQQEILKVEAELNEAKLLAELLGRDRLQLHLVRQAERQVVDHANSVLDRLSGGQLYLRLAGEAGGEGNSAKALELEAHNRVTGEKPINVAFLSGSQKFRVAVSLALGIGQYASRQHRAIESVIIDEGFGCLDRHGRQVMIQELQNLRGQLRCILLVSHQEEFAEAFSDGYRFELTNGTAVATRFQR
ncbi:MAG: SMC family ATPase [Gemmataceae bacterium]|nr:SMC family ATPase [Gemmataceae bacterium]